uniref:Uncharacterized protein n=1 Tax=Bartonella rochalimae ATCC BAA-1498 TaxID=685782 RepID=E6YMF1_9HYPH|nr:hypothetical protein BARRO_50402 [Bartonella rochalimae ATCC BAA-1498]
MDYGLATMIVFFIVNVAMFFAGFYFYKMTETHEYKMTETHEKETDKRMDNIKRKQENLIQTQKDLMEKN